MKIRNGHLAFASITSAILCPLPYILLLDEFSRESEIAPQILGFGIASLGVLAYCAVFFSALLFCYFSLKNKGLWQIEKNWTKPVLLLGLILAASYMVIGIGTFQGMYVENTVFYLISRFTPYFISIVFCLLASILVSSNIFCCGKVRVKWAMPCFPLVIIAAEKFFLGRFSDIDFLFGIAYLVIYAIYIGFCVRPSANCSFTA